MKKKLIPFLLVTLCFVSFESASAGTSYNGPVYFTFSNINYKIYYYTGTYASLYSFLGAGVQTNPGGGLPPNTAWPLMPWYGNQANTDAFVSAWQNAANRGGGVQYPNSSGQQGPYFAWQNDEANQYISSRYWDKTSGTIKDVITEDINVYSYGVVSISQ